MISDLIAMGDLSSFSLQDMEGIMLHHAQINEGDVNFELVVFIFKITKFLLYCHNLVPKLRSRRVLLQNCAGFN